MSGSFPWAPRVTSLRYRSGSCLLLYLLSRVPKASKNQHFRKWAPQRWLVILLLWQEACLRRRPTKIDVVYKQGSTSLVILMMCPARRQAPLFRELYTCQGSRSFGSARRIPIWNSVATLIMTLRHAGTGGVWRSLPHSLPLSTCPSIPPQAGACQAAERHSNALSLPTSTPSRCPAELSPS